MDTSENGASLIDELSRELRTPLTVISGYLETLSDVDTLWQGALAQVLQQSQRIEHIVDSLALLTRLQTAGTLGPAEDVDLRSCVTMVFDEMKLQYPGQKYRFSSDCEASVRISPDELYTALLKLIENASQSSASTRPDGYVSVGWCRYRLRWRAAH